MCMDVCVCVCIHVLITIYSVVSNRDLLCIKYASITVAEITVFYLAEDHIVAQYLVHIACTCMHVLPFHVNVK